MVEGLQLSRGGLKRSVLRRMSLSFLFLLFCSLSFAQSGNLKKANELYDKLAYAGAIKYYEKVLEKQFNGEAMSKLADCYRLTNQYDDASKWYSKLVYTNHAKPIHYFYYGQALMNQKRYKDAKVWFKNFADAKPEDPRGMRFYNACDSIKYLMQDSVGYEVKNLPLNSEESDFGVAYYQDGIVFASSRGGGVVARNYDWDGKPFLDLYYAELQDEKALKFSKPKTLNGRLNTRFHEAVASFSPEQNVVYFTRNNFIEGKKGKDEKGVVHLQVYYAEVTNRGWKNLKSVPFNNDLFSVGHPWISPDGKKMYFASDMPKGYGGTDLYVSEFREGNWGTPVNLGPLVNTSSNEMFPFLHPDGTLWFASEGHQGLGGLDIFSAKFDEIWGNVTNPGYPINSSFDDFAYILDEDLKTGYFSSNRPGGKGGDDVYWFEVKSPVLTGIVTDKLTGEPIDAARVTLVEVMDGKEVEVYSSTNGKFAFPLQPDREYKLITEKPGYSEEIQTIDTKGIKPDEKIDTEVKLSAPFLVLEGLVVDQQTKEPIPGATVVLTQEGKEIATDPNGEFTFNLEENKLYTLEIRKDGYVTETYEFIAPEDIGDGVVKARIELRQEKGSLLLKGVVLERISRHTIADVDVTLRNKNTGKELHAVSNEVGGFDFALDPQTPYTITATKFGYDTTVISFDTPDSPGAGVTTTEVLMDLLAFDKPIVLKNIYYDFDKWDIRSDARPDLDKLLNFLKENPNLRIELGSHTDSRGNDQYNLRLSQKRAESAVKYLAYRGIPEDRILAVGYGEQKLVNPCANGVICTESQHQNNRRTEFKIIGYYQDGKILSSIPRDDAYYFGAGMGETGQPQIRWGSSNVGDDVEENPPAENVMVANPKEESDLQETKYNTPTEVWAEDPNLSAGEPGVVFRIQIGVFSSRPKKDFLASLGVYRVDLDVTPVNGMQRYTVGKYYDYSEAVNHLKSLRGSGFKDAFLIAFDGGQRISATEGKKRTGFNR